MRTIRQAHINACTFGGRLGEKTRSEVGRLIENLEGHLGHDKKTILENLLAAKVAWEEMHDMDSVSQT